MADSPVFLAAAARAINNTPVVEAVQTAVAADADYARRVISREALEHLSEDPVFAHVAARQVGQDYMIAAVRAAISADPALRARIIDAEILEHLRGTPELQRIAAGEIKSPAAELAIRAALESDAGYRDRIITETLLQAAAGGAEFRTIAAGQLTTEPLVRAVRTLLLDDTSYARAVLDQEVLRKSRDTMAFVTVAAGSIRATGVQLAIQRLMMRDLEYARVLLNEQIIESVADDAMVLEPAARRIDSPRLVDAAKDALRDNEAYAARLLTTEILKVVADRDAFAKATSTMLRVGGFRTSVQHALGDEPVLAAKLAGSPAVLSNLLDQPWKGKGKLLDFTGRAATVWRSLERIYGKERLEEVAASVAPPERGFGRETDVRDYMLSRLCEGNIMRLPHGEIEFIDRRSLWTLVNEILIDEEYYFHSDKPDPVIIDCGANFGMSTVYWKLLYPDARITAFEPIAEYADLVRANVRRNNFTNVDVHTAALSDHGGQETFFVSEDHSMAGSLTERRTAFGDAIHEITVDTVRLSEYITGPVDYLKLDIEGAEPRVLAEIEDKLKWVDQLTMEWHIDPDKTADGLSEALVRLERAGFAYGVAKSYNYLRATSHRPISHVSGVGTFNVWAIKRDSLKRFRD